MISASETDLITELLACIGFEFQYRSNLNLRLDYGVVLQALKDSNELVIDDADQGDSRFHFLATYSF
jgi:hypothetical protein